MVNTHVKVQAVDLDGDGKEEVIVCNPDWHCGEDAYRGKVFEVITGPEPALEYTGISFPEVLPVTGEKTPFDTFPTTKAQRHEGSQRS